MVVKLKNITLLLLLWSMSSCSYFKKDAAIKYNNVIVEIQSHILTRMDAFSQSFGVTDSVKIATELEALKSTLDSSISATKALKGFNGNTNLRDAAVQLFEFYQRTAVNDYVELINIFKKEDFNEADKAKVDEINARIGKEEGPYDEALQKAQEELATTYHFKMEEQKK